MQLSDEKTEGHTVACNLHFSQKLCVPATLFPKPSTSDSREKTMGEQKGEGMEVQDQDQGRQEGRVATRTIKLQDKALSHLPPVALAPLLLAWTSGAVWHAAVCYNPISHT